MAEVELTLNSPITEEQWDIITDVDFDHTNRIFFNTKHGKTVEFVKATDPVVDAVPVVRCKDCKYCHIVDEYEAWCYGGLPASLTRATEDFCSHGQRREDGAT